MRRAWQGGGSRGRMESQLSLQGRLSPDHTTRLDAVSVMCTVQGEASVGLCNAADPGQAVKRLRRQASSRASRGGCRGRMGARPDP